ncbi:molybdenum cofactor guanylyltransferase [Methanosalsum natronophilum]|uniref:Probable molybdenum cofactor guanylyltransferase n=1 Tax=Methanosalsum natronophilum TaxID=768733 RepID=A0A3R7VYF8_9EURY|nr:molybdenum cofactor guanylyltransferase [Methanosalsum natronophilum]MCS3924860.1 molybdopterin-guanine dinucleotide biosynthesis protein A [Methanosalsum natronophilum]RQD86026.1 MAG: molybdenum cofactor guanylyltransferase [Methanosalsum natronophilum]
MNNFSFLILAGGYGVRLGNIDKGLIQLGFQTLLERIINTGNQLSAEIIISFRDENQKQVYANNISHFLNINKIVFDKREGIGPLEGIFQGAKIASSKYIFITAVDMPFINKNVIELICKYAQNYDAVIPIWENGRLEPLHSVYRTNILIKESDRSIKRGERYVIAPIRNFENIFYLNTNIIRSIDPELKSFTNINTHKDLMKAKNIFK